MTRKLLPIASPARVRAALGELVAPRWKLAVAAFSVLFTGAAVGLATAPLLGRIVDLVGAGRGPEAITWPVVALACVAVAQGACAAVGVTLVARLGEGVLARLRERFVERALLLPLERVEEAGAGDLTSRVTRDVQVVADGVRNALPVMARSALTIGLTVVGIGVLDWRFLIPVLLAAPIQAHTVRWYGGRAVRLYAAQRVAVGAQQQQLLDSIGGAATVRAFGLAERHAERVRERSDEAVSLALRGIRLLTRFYGRLNAAEFVGLGGLLVVGFWLVQGGSVTVGAATAAALYFHGLFNPINAALALADDAQAASASLARLVGVADERTDERADSSAGAGSAASTSAPAGAPAGPDSPDPLAAHDPVAAPGLPAPGDAGVSLAGVGHEYVAGHPVVRGVDLEVKPGERVALVGASGAGKTTLAKIIAGVHRPTSGTVLVGGAPLERAARSVALITQEVHVFAGPLVEDLRLARPGASVADVEEALERVGALRWARALPEGLETVVGEGGRRVTAAQAQQLALARLVLADPPVAVLDEATAEAGSAGAGELEVAAARALDGRTGLLVAHRLTQAAEADRVVVLEAGRVVESGTHAALLAVGGRYATLWAAWSGTRAGGAPGAVAGPADLGPSRAGAAVSGGGEPGPGLRP
ncbi:MULTISPECIES: ABC transporter ATP-binding protein [Actinosynnema]|uniref:ABC transporter ATP-binding protein n=1 Tax=Actinosynnema TaxID=40566 RepID=UPI0020A50F6F|nr:ABC transporter ATP-binding protein [Actinosynnema pretiosum]MCP2098570.1 ATP-binding cassette, subfamily C [Actinosynnema pretiosum]